MAGPYFNANLLRLLWMYYIIDYGIVYPKESKQIGIRVLDIRLAVVMIYSTFYHLQLALKRRLSCL
jgi:hypothetical protein